MPKSNTGTFIEFTQAYGESIRVTKRGMNATPMVVRKHDLGEQEVIAFTSWLDNNHAMTAFHFHESFPLEDRQDYMCKHEDGIALLDEVRNQKAMETAGLNFFETGRWQNFKWQLLKLAGLLGRLTRLLFRPFNRPTIVLPKVDVEAPSEPVVPLAPPLLAEKQREALPESFARRGALPHWERGYNEKPLSKEELIVLEQGKGQMVGSRTIH